MFESLGNEIVHIYIVLMSRKWYYTRCVLDNYRQCRRVLHRNTATGNVMSVVEASERTISVNVNGKR